LEGHIHFRYRTSSTLARPIVHGDRSSMTYSMHCHICPVCIVPLRVHWIKVYTVKKPTPSHHPFFLTPSLCPYSSLPFCLSLSLSSSVSLSCLSLPSPLPFLSLSLPPPSRRWSVRLPGHLREKPLGLKV